MPSLKEVEQALDHCMREQPPVNYALSSDASKIADVLAVMWHFNETERDFSSFSEKQKEAFLRWS